MRNILVTGSTGFLGRHLIKKLKNLDYNIYVPLNLYNIFEKIFGKEEMFNFEDKFEIIQKFNILFNSNKPFDFLNKKEIEKKTQ
mgnify:CR=1 FL=1